MFMVLLTQHQVHLMNVEQAAADLRPSQSTWTAIVYTHHHHLLLLLSPTSDTHLPSH